MASLADSGLDLVASLVTFFAVRYAVAPPDAEHRFGHGKAEAFSSLTQAGLVFASGALIGQEAIKGLLHPKPIAAEGLGVAVMVVSILLTLALIRAQSEVMKRTRSVAVSGDKAHYAADLASNAVSLIGIAAAGFLGLTWVDAAAGLIVAAWLIWGAIGVFREAVAPADGPRAARRGPRPHPGPADRRSPGSWACTSCAPRPRGRSSTSRPTWTSTPTRSLALAHTLMVEAEARVLEAFPTADILIHPDPRGVAEPHAGAFSEREPL